MLKRSSSSALDIPDLDVYYEDCVIGGPGAFVIPVRTRDEMLRAIKTKMVLEVAGVKPKTQPGSSPPPTLAHSPAPSANASGRRTGTTDRADHCGQTTPRSGGGGGGSAGDPELLAGVTGVPEKMTFRSLEPGWKFRTNTAPITPSCPPLCRASTTNRLSLHQTFVLSRPRGLPGQL